MGAEAGGFWYLGISAPTIARVPSSSPPACLQGKLLGLDSPKSSSSSRIGGSGLSLPSFSWIPSNCSALSLIFRDFFLTEWPEEWISFFSGWWAWAKSGALWPEVNLSVSWIEVRLVVSSRASRSCLANSDNAEDYNQSFALIDTWSATWFGWLVDAAEPRQILSLSQKYFLVPQEHKFHNDICNCFGTLLIS